MKKIFGITLLLGIAVLFDSCKDPDLNPYKEPEPGVHGYAVIRALTFVEGRMSTSRVDFDFKWMSLDRKVNINRVEFYVYFNEPYIDQNGNAVMANHGGAEPTGGRTHPDLSFTGLGNFETRKFTITAAQIYGLYANATYKYDGKTARPVFGTNRPSNRRFLSGDNIVIRWRLYGDNGLVYRSWSPAIESGEFIAGGNGANGSISFDVR